MLDKFRGINIPIGGVMDVATRLGWTLVPSVWAGATPSSYITRDAFERIAGDILHDLRLALPAGLDGIYLDLHGAAVAEHCDDAEGELLDRIRALVGADLPIVVSLDLHANVTELMLRHADALVSYRTYPHVDMAATGELAAQLLQRRLRRRQREDMHAIRLPFLIPLNGQSTWMEPAKSIYEELLALDREFDTVLSFCMAFPAADFAECAPMVWGHGERAREAVERLTQRVSEPTQWRQPVLPAREAVAHAMTLADQDARPVVIADTQDNPGAGGDSNTTGMLHALRAQGAGMKFPGQVALGLMADGKAAAKAHAAGVGAEIDLALGTAVPTFTGEASDPPVQGRFKVVSLHDGTAKLTGAMSRGRTVQLGLSACLEIDGIRIAVTEAKTQMLDRDLFRAVGIQPEQMHIVVVKSSNHFRADFTPIASHVLVAKAAGPMAADPGDLPWRKLPDTIRRRP